MRDDFRPIKQALLAARPLVALGDALTAANEATNTASGEHEDLRETVHRLESLVTELLRRNNPTEGGPHAV